MLCSSQQRDAHINSRDKENHETVGRGSKVDKPRPAWQSADPPEKETEFVYYFLFLSNVSRFLCVVSGLDDPELQNYFQVIKAISAWRHLSCHLGKSMKTQNEN